MYTDLQEYFMGKYGKAIDFRKAKKQECPECGHKTLYLYDNREKAKCFHPECDKHWNIHTLNKGIDYLIDISEYLFQDFKKAFEPRFVDKKFCECRAYSFCKDERKINPSVLSMAEIGVVPDNYDVEKLFDDSITKIKDDIIESSENMDLAKSLKAKLSDLEEKKKDLANLISFVEGHLCFFYRNSRGIITLVKFREPYSKNIKMFKFRQETGLFNYKIIDLPLKSFRGLTEYTAVFEGEFNQLSYHSAHMHSMKPSRSCAIGGAQGVDLSALKNLNDKLVVFFDNDEAGRGLLEKIRNEMAVFAISAPEPYNDFDEYIKTIAPSEQFKATFELLNQSKKYYRDDESIKNEVKNILKADNKEISTIDKPYEVTRIIKDELLNRGTFYSCDGCYYIFLESSKRIIDMSLQTKDFKILLTKFGVNPSLKNYNFVLEELIADCHENGRDVEIHNFTYFNPKTFCLYVYSGDRIVYKIAPDKIETIENGDDGVMFLHKNGFEPFELVDFDKEKDYIKAYVTDFMNIDEEATNIPIHSQKVICKMWLLGLFFESIMKTKVLFCTVGEKGSGKTSFLKRIGLILFGSKFNVTPSSTKIDDFDTIITNNYFIVLDNIDSAIKGLNDKLACIATGQKVKKRILYTTNEEVELETKCFVSLTSRTPHFTRDDVADRLICIYFKRIEGFVAESELMQGIAEHRNEILSSLFFELQKIIQALHKAQNKKIHTNFRIADFANFALKIALTEGTQSEMEEILNQIIDSQNNFATKDDLMVLVLREFVNGRYREGEEYTPTKLYQAMCNIAETLNLKHFTTIYKSPGSAMKRLNNLKHNLRDEIQIDIRKGRANTTNYSFQVLQPSETTQVQEII